MNPRPSFYRQLLRRIIPRLLTALCTVSVVLSLAIFFFARQQITEEQRDSLQYLKKDMSVTIKSTRQLMEGIASHDLLINSFIDVQQRQNYLPVFFDSLKLTRAKEYSLGLFQFDGTPLITKDWENRVPASLRSMWRETTLGNSQTMQYVGANGTLIAVPVLMGGQAEGALVLYVPTLRDLIFETTHTGHQLILSENGTILYASHADRYAMESQYDAALFTSWLVESEPWHDLTLLHQIPAIDAFSNVLWLLPALFITLISAILVSVYASMHAAKLSAGTLQALFDSINGQSDSRDGPSLNPEGEPQELFVIRQAFEKLLSNLTSMTLSNTQFSNVIDSLEEVLVVLDEKSNKQLTNRSFTEHKSLCALSDEDLAAIRQQLISGPGEVEGQYEGTEGAPPITIRWSMLPLIDTQGKQVGHILVGNNITRHRSLEARINVISHAMKSATLSILIAERQGGSFPIIYSNPHFSLVTGFGEHEVLGESHFLLDKMKADRNKLRQMKSALKNGLPYSDTLQCYRQNNSFFYNQVIITPVHAQGELTHYVAFFQDVTEQEQTQQFLKDAKLRAEESTRLKSSFLASMSHEVRTPLHGISGALQLVNNTELNKAQARYISLAKDSLNNLKHIVDDILDFSKIEAGQLHLEALPFNLTLLIKTVYDQYAISCREKGITFTLNYSPQGRDTIIGDPIRLRQILGNLLSNAVKFTEHGGINLTVNIRESSGRHRLFASVEDTGIGISKTSLESIFEAFRQEDTSTTRRFGGTGLGLSICRQLCQLLGGELVARSEKGKGSCFSFDIAIDSTDKHADDNLAITEATTVIPHFKAKIMIVEDNEVNQLIAREHLKQHKIMTAKNGREALEALTRMRISFNAILMDCHMPEMDGFEATKRIRRGEAGERYRNIPIIALTANALKGDRELCTAAGMDDYISKPFTAEDLLTVLARYCS